MLKPIIFWGGTGHAKVLREFMAQRGYNLIAVFDNNANVAPPFADVPLFHGREAFCTWKEQFGSRLLAGLVAIGGGHGEDRCEIQRLFASHGIEIPMVVHPTAFVADNAQLGEGTQVLARAVVGVEARLGEACIVNTQASVDHECVLGNGVHIAPGATLAGCVSVGDFSLIAVGAVVLPRIRIGRNVTVGAGAVVTRDVPDDVVVYGNPARVRHHGSAR